MNKAKKQIRFIILIVVALLLLQSGNIFRLFFPAEYIDFIRQYSEEYEVEPYLIMAVIKAESNFRRDAVSHKEARGLMQLTPETAFWLAEKLGMKDFREEEIHNPKTNIRLGCYYLAYLGTMYDGNLKCALAAYNAGNGTVDRWLCDIRYSKDGVSLSKIPYRETEQYVNKVLNYRNVYRILYHVREGRKV